MIVGIDPGLKGGFCFLLDGVARATPMPLGGDKVDVGDVYNKLMGSPLGTVVVIEKQSYRPGQAGVVTNLSNYGRLLACAEISGFKLIVVDPKVWKKLVLGNKYPHDKEGAIAFCADTYPETKLILPRCRTPHDGMADSVCIAHYGAILYGR